MLYQNTNEHKSDCDRYPFKKIPRKVFLDTNVINRMVRWDEQIFEFEAIPSEATETEAQDIEALMHVLMGLDRTSIKLVASAKTLDELLATSDPAWRRALHSFGVEFVHDEPDSADRLFATDFGRRLVGSQFVMPLPDHADQELIGHAIALGCDTFCTCDRKSIIKKRHLLRLPIRILTPVEWWAHMKLWAGLWS